MHHHTSHVTAALGAWPSAAQLRGVKSWLRDCTFRCIYVFYDEGSIPIEWVSHAHLEDMVRFDFDPQLWGLLSFQRAMGPAPQGHSW